MRRFISVLLVLIMIATLSLQIFAGEQLHNSDQVKVAFIKSINEDGSNIGTDKTNSDSILSDIAYDISYSLALSQLSINGVISGVPFSVAGKIVTTNENRNLLLYETFDEHNNYDILYMALERELDETALFFREFQQDNKNYTNVIKLYMQHKKTNAIILIEIFIVNDCVTTFLNIQPVRYDNAKANEIQAWFVKCYKPIEKKNVIVQSRANVGYETLDLSETYNHIGSTVTFHFVVRLYYTATDLSPRAAGYTECYYYVQESRTSSDLAANNSSTQGYIRLEEMNISFSTMSNVLCTSQQAMRTGLSSDYGYAPDLSFSVSISVAYKLASASASLSFNETKVMSSELLPLPYSDAGTYGYKAVSCGELPSNLYLCNQGGVYGFRINYMDTSGARRAGTTLVKFEYCINNLFEFTWEEAEFQDSFIMNVG